MDTNIVGVGVGITERFRTVVEEKASRIETLAPRAQGLEVKVTHRAYHNGRMEDETVELTLGGKGPVVRAEATDGDKFTALDLAVDKMAEQLRRAKDKRVDARNHPRGAKFEKESGSLAGIDIEPASAELLHAVATGEVPIVQADETFPDGSKTFRIQDFGPGNDLDDTPVFEVPAGHYFMMGDNRDNSIDSRVDPSQNGVGLVPAENLIGKAEIILFSWNEGASLWNPVSWFSKVRLDRWFNVLD